MKTVKKPPLKAATANTYRQEYESKNDEQVATSYQDILLWHKCICSVSGGLSLRIAKRSLSRIDVHNWATALHQVASEMESWLKEKEK